MILKGLIKKIGLKKKLNDAAKAFQKNDFESAEKLYLEVLDKDPDHFEGQLWLGSLYSEMGKYPKAVDLLEKSVKLRPSDFQPYFNLALLQAKLNREELAIEIFEKALNNCTLDKSRKAEIFYNIGRLKIDLRDYGAAMDYANKALSIHPNYQQAEQIKMYAFNQLRN